jgi:hypothetical protein
MRTNFIFDDHHRRLLGNLFGEMDESSLKQIFESANKIELEQGNIYSIKETKKVTFILCFQVGLEQLIKIKTIPWF